MSENPFAGATRDPIALLEQLIKQTAEVRRDIGDLKQDIAVLKEDVAVLKQDMAVLKADVAQMKQDLADLNGRVGRLEERVDLLSKTTIEIRTELKDFRGEIVRMHRTMDEAYAAFKTQVSAEIDHKAWLESQKALNLAENRWLELERRIAELEAAERRRREGAGA